MYMIMQVHNSTNLAISQGLAIDTVFARIKPPQIHVNAGLIYTLGGSLVLSLINAGLRLNAGSS